MTDAWRHSHWLSEGGCGWCNLIILSDLFLPFFSFPLVLLTSLLSSPFSFLPLSLFYLFIYFFFWSYWSFLFVSRFFIRLYSLPLSLTADFSEVSPNVLPGKDWCFALSTFWFFQGGKKIKARRHTHINGIHSALVNISISPWRWYE